MRKDKVIVGQKSHHQGKKRKAKTIPKLAHINGRISHRSSYHPIITAGNDDLKINWKVKLSSYFSKYRVDIRRSLTKVANPNAKSYPPLCMSENEKKTKTYLLVMNRRGRRPRNPNIWANDTPRTRHRDEDNGKGENRNPPPTIKGLFFRGDSGGLE